VLEIFQEVGVSNPNAFVPPRLKLNPYLTKVLEKLRFNLAEIEEMFVLFSPQKKFKKIKI
jgi:predicted deacetylase